jgi:hypothetical protein
MVEENRAMGFTSPVVLDTLGSAMRSFGATGTPMALLVDAEGYCACRKAWSKVDQDTPVG